MIPFVLMHEHVHHSITHATDLQAIPGHGSGEEGGTVQVLHGSHHAWKPHYACTTQVTSNVDRGPLARKRDVGFIYHGEKMRELQKQAAELEVPFPFPKQVGA